MEEAGKHTSNHRSPLLENHLKVNRCSMNNSQCHGNRAAVEMSEEKYSIHLLYIITPHHINGCGESSKIGSPNIFVKYFAREFRSRNLRISLVIGREL